jgi:hypothetical protein
MRRASLAAAVIVIRSSAQKSKSLFAGRLQFSMWVDAEDGEESLAMYIPMVLTSTSSGGVAW